MGNILVIEQSFLISSAASYSSSGPDGQRAFQTEDLRGKIWDDVEDDVGFVRGGPKLIS